MLAKRTLVYSIASVTSADTATSRRSTETDTASTKSKHRSSSEATSKKSCCAKKKKDAGHRKNVLLRDSIHRHSASSHLFQPVPCIKDYKRPKPNCRMNFRGSGMTVPPVVQPVIGICHEGRCGLEHKVEEVRYAMVRISIFNEFTTYEVLKSSTRKPKKIAPVVEGIFVTKN